ncbi:MAG TPA: DUF92 domain-containing protein [Terriglobales bacterium]
MTLHANTIVALQLAKAPAVSAAAVTVVFAAVAWLLKGVTNTGALAGAVISFAIYLGAGAGAFVALVCVFLIAVGTTRLGYTRKQQLGAAENREGRSGSQILANLGVAALAAVLFGITRKPIYLIACGAALAEAAADTASSEIGEVSSQQARLITTFQLVPAGTNGGVTFAGTIAGLIASVIVAGCCVLTKMIPAWAFFFVSVAGFVGMLLDSVLGAVLERRGQLNNDTVNFLGTLSAALTAVLLARMLA